MFNIESLLNIKINKIFCISLESRKDRREYLKTQFEKFSDKVHFKIVKKHSEPIRGCLESHIKCIKEAKDNNFENILILEDDILINEKILTDIDTIQIPENFDMFYLGYHVNNGIKYGKNILKILSGQTTHAYIINKRIFDYVLDNIDKEWESIIEWNIRNKYERLTNFKVKAIDLFYSKWVHHRRQNSYGIFPILIYQKPDFSDIENRVIDYRKLMTDKSEEFFKEKPYQNEIWVLNLDKRNDRWIKIQKKVKEYNLNAFRIRAIDGLNFNFEKYKDLFSLRDFNLRIKNNYKTHENNKPVLGCALSHYKMWETISQNKNLNNEDFTLILEDDCYFTDNFEVKLNLLLDELKFKSWDICFIGYTDYVPLEDSIEGFGDKKEGNNLIKLSGNRRMRGGGTFGYLITKTGAKKFYTLANDRCIQQAVDWFMIEQYDKVNAYKTKNDLIFSNVAGINGHDSDIQEQDPNNKIFFDINLKFYNFQNNLFFKDQYNNLFTIDEPFDLKYVGNLVDNKKIEIRKFQYEQSKIKLKFTRGKEYIAFYVGSKMKVFIHYLAKYLKNKLNKNVTIFHNSYDVIIDDIQYININKFDKLNVILKYSYVFLFDILMFVSNMIRTYNKLHIIEDGEFFYNIKYQDTIIPNNGINLFQNLIFKVNKIIGISDTIVHFFKVKTSIMDNIPILPPIFEENDIIADKKIKLNINDILFISYDSDIKSVLKFFHILNIKNKKLLIFSNVFKSTDPKIIIKPKIYKFNFSYLNYGTFFITQTKLTDNYYALNLAFKKGLVCIIPNYYKELSNKTISFKNNLIEVKENVESCINIKNKINIYQKISKSYTNILTNKLDNINEILF